MIENKKARMTLFSWILVLGFGAAMTGCQQDCPECPPVCEGADVLQVSLAAVGDETSDGTSADGTNTLALQYVYPKFAGALEKKIVAAGGSVVSIQRYNPATNGFEPVPGTGSLVPGEALLVEMETGTDICLGGGFQPNLALNLMGPEHPDSASGINFIALPYHATAGTAQELIDEITSEFGSVVENVQRYNRATGDWEPYDPDDPGSVPFPIVPGEGYKVQMTTTVSWIPQHY